MKKFVATKKRATRGRPKTSIVTILERDMNIVQDIEGAKRTHIDENQLHEFQILAQNRRNWRELSNMIAETVKIICDEDEDQKRKRKQRETEIPEEDENDPMHMDVEEMETRVEEGRKRRRHRP
jgi:thiamine kinase-like enzyme